jgi:hypothetical protein
MIFPPKSPDVTESRPAQGEGLNETPPTDAPLAKGAFATPPKSAKPRTSMAYAKHLKLPRATLVPALRSGPTAFSESSLQKRIPGVTRMAIGLAVACFSALPAYSSVTISWEQYHVSGETSPYLPIPSYSITDSNPISGNDGWSAYSSAWKFGASASTGDSMGRAGASSTFVFTVDKPILIIKFAGSLWARAHPDIQGGISYSLTENLTNSVISNRTWSLTGDDFKGQWFSRDIDESTIHNLTTGNQYKLLISANVTHAEGSHAYLNAVLVPEPSSLMLLSFGGLGGLFLRRRNQKQAGS